MALGLQTQGLLELDALRKRAKRQHLLKRITREDCEWLVDRLDEIEARIISMQEVNTDL
jgi:hypothetical protein